MQLRRHVSSVPAQTAGAASCLRRAESATSAPIRVCSCLSGADDFAEWAGTEGYEHAAARRQSAATLLPSWAQHCNMMFEMDGRLRRKNRPAFVVFRFGCLQDGMSVRVRSLPKLDLTSVCHSCACYSLDLSVCKALSQGVALPE